METTEKKLAERIYHKVLGELAEGDLFERLPGEEKPLSELFCQYLNELSKPNKSDKSYIWDKGMVVRILKEFGEVTRARYRHSRSLSINRDFGGDHGHAPFNGIL
jgi:hypothetical protein